MKHYKKFYEIGNNRYYTIVADDEMYIATESFLKLGSKNILGKEKELRTGLKLLKFSSPIAQLFLALDNLEFSKKQRYDSDDLKIYAHINNRELKENIKKAYLDVYNQEVESVRKQRDELIEDGKIEIAKSCEEYLQKLEKLDLMDGIDLNSPEYTGSPIIKSMIWNGFEHLYTEKVNAFTKNVFLYEQDEFGTLTIYKIITIKNVVKTIDTFIYDKELVKNLLEYLYKEGR